MEAIPDDKHWTEHARCLQENYEYYLSDFIAYNLSSPVMTGILCEKIGFAVFGGPEVEPSADNENIGYKPDKLKVIKAIKDKLLELNSMRSEITLGTLFVIVQSENRLSSYPVFRIHLLKSYQFVDSECRTYKSWENFLKTNVLPPGEFCWPEGGFYSVDSEGDVRLGFGETVASSIGRKVINVLDKANLVASLGCIGVTGATLLALPVAAPVAAVATGCGLAGATYGVGRSVGSLVDRGRHGQTVNPTRDRQAFGSWLSIVGSVVGMGAAKATSTVTTMARNGKILSAGAQVVVNTLNISSLAVNGVGIIYGLINLKERYDANTLKRLEIIQFAASVLFFTHSTVTFQTAKSIIVNTQKQTIHDYEQSLRSNRHRKEFNRLRRNTTKGMEAMEGNAKVIRSVRRIDNSDDFFAAVIRNKKYVKEGEVRETFSENGGINMNQSVEVCPVRFNKMTNAERKAILKLAKSGVQGTVTASQFESEAGKLMANKPTATTSQTSGRNGLTSLLKLENLTNIFKFVVSETDYTIVLTVVEELVNYLEPYVRDKSEILGFTVKFVLSHLREMEQVYQAAKEMAKAAGEYINEREFNRAQGIDVCSRVVFFVTKLLELYESGSRYYRFYMEQRLRTPSN